MSKTPYEIRLELLQMAKDYMDKAQAAQIEFAKDAYAKSVELGTISAAEAKKQLAVFVPQQYTLDELMKKATELYSFVSKKLV